MSNTRDGRGNDTVFPQYISDAFTAAVYPVASVIVTPPSDGGGTTPPPPDPTGPPGQVIQPKILLAEWRCDSPGTVDLDYSLGLPVVTKWRDITNTYTLSAPSIAQAPFWVTPTNTSSGHPALSFDGVDDWLESLSVGAKLNNLSGCSVSMRANVMTPPVNAIERLVWLESGVAGVPRFGYARSGIGGTDFYLDGATKDTDTVSPLTGGNYEYDGWANHTARRDYLNGLADVEFNGGLKTQGGGIQTMNYGDSSYPLRFRLGAQDGGHNPGAFFIYGIRLYTYYISDTEMLADAAYYGGFA